MKKFLVLVFALAIGTSFAKVDDSGVLHLKDDFTGGTTCYQIVDNSPSSREGIAMFNEGGELSVIFRQGFDIYPNGVAFNRYGEGVYNKVYVKIGDEVEILKPTAVHHEINNGQREQAYFVDLDINHHLFTKLLSSPQDVRVRFSGSIGNVDFTIRHGVIVALAQGFGQTCLK